MARMAIAIAAILVVVLSAGFTTTPLTSAAQSSGRVTQQARSVMNATSPGLLFGGMVQPASTAQNGGTSEDGPPLVLLAYLGLVIVGSALAIGSVRANGGRDL